MPGYFVRTDSDGSGQEPFVRELCIRLLITNSHVSKLSNYIGSNIIIIISSRSMLEISEVLGPPFHQKIPLYQFSQRSRNCGLVTKEKRCLDSVASNRQHIGYLLDIIQ